MPAFILVVLFRILGVVFSTWTRRHRRPAPKSLCSECAFAHIQFGACGRRAISCTFGGGVRPIKLDVLYCTDYRPRTEPVRPGIGFVRTSGTPSLSRPLRQGGAFDFFCVARPG